MERRPRRWWLRLEVLIAALIILAAAISALFQLLVASLPEYRRQAEQRLSAVVGAPVSMSALRLAWHDFEPVLVFDRLRIEPAQGAPLALTHLRVGLDLGQLLLGRLDVRSLTAVGLHIDLTRDATGQLHGPDLGPAGGASGDLDAFLRRLHAVQCERCRVQLRDEILHARYDFGLPRLRLRRADDGVLHLRFTLLPPSTLGGEVHGHLSIRGELQHPSRWSGSFALNVRRLRSLPWLDHRLRSGSAVGFADAALTLHGRLDHGWPTRVEARFSADTIAARRHGKPLAALHQVHLVADLGGDAAGWHLRLDPLQLGGAQGAWPDSHDSLQWLPDADGGYTLAADIGFLRLGDLLPWLSLWPHPPPELSRIAGARGDVSNVLLRAEMPGNQQPPRYHLVAQLHNGGWRSADGAVTLSGLTGALQADDDGGRFTPAAHLRPRLKLPRLFASTVQPEFQAATLRWQRRQNGWQLGIDPLDLRMAGGEAHGRLRIDWPPAPAKAELHTDLRVDVADLTRLLPWLPRTWGAGTRAWLRRAVHGGAIRDGRIRIDGPLDDPTSSRAGGRWSADLPLRDGHLAFARDWPAATGLQGILHLQDHRLELRGGSGKIAGIDATDLSGGIDDFRQPKLQLHIASHGDAARYYALIGHSPLRQRLAGVLRHTSASGPLSARFDLGVDLRDTHDTQASGTLTGSGLTLQVKGLKQPLEAVSGTLHFDGSTVHAQGVQARWHGTRLTLDLAPDGDGDLLTGRFDLDPAQDALAAAFVPDWLRTHLRGRSRWQLRLPLGGSHGGELTLASSLRGTASTLPGFLAEPATGTLPISLEVAASGQGTTGSDDTDLVLAVGRVDSGLLRSRMRLDTDGHLQAASFRLGAGAPLPLPDAGIVIGGHIAQLDLRALVALLRLLPQGGGDAPPLATSTLHADALVYGSAHSGPTTLTLTPQTDGLRLDLDGTGAAGRLHYDPADNAVRGQIRHLVLAPFPSKRTPTKTATRNTAALQPAKLPTVDLRLADLQVGKTRLGQWLLRTNRVDGGQHIDLLKASGGVITGSATGHWRRRGGHSTAALKFSFDVSRIGAVLKTFGFTDNITAKKAHFSGDLAWPRTLGGLTLAGAAGTLGLRLENGTLKTVHPGAGRVLGLLNLYALPRRLTLNFHDVVDKGLGYDHIQGDFSLSQGQARTHNLRIKAPSLRMDIDGRIGLAAEDFDEIITVHPDYSTGVTLGAALLGGPIAGGIALLAQQLVGKALDSLTSLSYRLSGSWDNPQVKRIGTTAAKTAKKSALASPASAPAAPGSAPSVHSLKPSPPP